MNLLHANNPGCRVATMIFIFTLVAVCGEVSAGPCNSIKRSAFQACMNDAADDYWTTRGNCTNESDRETRKECKAEAEEALKEDKGSCREQKGARKDICTALGDTRYAPEIDPDNFVDPAEIGGTVSPNTYFPLVPGATWEYESSDETINVTVTTDTIEILGVTCVIVRDLVAEDGETIEDTDDYYAQDIDGNVWYFGEISQNFEDGLLDNLDGSWRSGVESAQPGIIMPASPMIGDIYRQEYSLTEAEDMAEIVATTASESTTGATCSDDCLQTSEFTPIEPEVSETKYYKPGVGFILAIDEETGEREELIEFNIPE